MNGQMKSITHPLIERLRITESVLRGEAAASGLSLEQIANITAAYIEIGAIAAEFETLNQEHIRQTDELRSLQEITEDVSWTMRARRRSLSIYHDEISNLSDDVSSLIDDLAEKITAEQNGAAAMRGALEGIRQTVHDRYHLNGEKRRLTDILEHVSSEVTSALNAEAGKDLRDDIRRLEGIVKEFEDTARANGNNVYYGDRELSSRMQRVVNYYTRLAATSVSNAKALRDDILTWMRAMAINAESVSWGQTHQEKNARLRGLIEVIERACKDVNDLRVEDAAHSWNFDMGGWMRSDFPVREFKRRIYELEAENKRLKETHEVATE